MSDTTESQGTDGPSVKDQQRLNYILDGAGLGSWDWWLETNAVQFDRRWAEMLGLKLEEIAQDLSTWHSRVHPDDKAKAYEDIKSYLAGKTTVYENIHRMRHANGQWVWILDRGRISEYGPDGKPIRFTGTHFDITRYKESEELNASIQSIAQIGGWELDVATMTTKWTDETYRLHNVPIGTPTNTLMGVSFYAPHDQARISNYVEECINGKAYREIFEFYDAAGNHKWVEAMGEPVYDAHGRVIKLRRTFQDISERKRQEIRTRKTEAFLRSTYEQSHDAMMIAKGPDWRFIECNRAALDLFGIHSIEAFRGLRAEDLSPPLQLDGSKSLDKHLRMIKQAMDSGSAFYEWDFLRHDGKTVPCTVSVSKIQFDHEVFLHATVRDVSEERATKAALESLITSLDDIVFELNGEGVFRNAWTHDDSKLFVPRQQLIGKNYREVLPLDLADRLTQAFVQLRQKGMAAEFEYHSDDRLGGQVWFRARLMRQKRTDGREKYSLVVRDITEDFLARELRDRAIRELERYFEVALEMLCICGQDGFFRKLNPVWSQVLGYSAEELMARPFIEFVHPEDVSASIMLFDQIMNGIPAVKFENRYKTKDGSYRILMWSASKDPETGMIYAAARDITEARAKDLELKQIMDVIDRAAIVAFTDRQGNITQVNENFCKISGYSRAELIGQNHRILNAGTHSKTFFRELWEKISSSQIWSGEIENRSKSGEHYVVQSLIAPLKDLAGKVDRYMALRFDVTKQRESERLLREAQHASKIGSWSLQIDTGWMRWSEQMFELFHEDASQVTPSLSRYLQCIHPEDREIWQLSLRRCQQTGQTFSCRYRIIVDNGLLKWIEAHGEPVFDQQVVVRKINGTCQDITALVVAEDAVRAERAKAIQAAKLSSLGELSASIAHEINNPLTIIVGMIRGLDQMSLNPEKLRTRVQTIEKASERIARIVQGLRKFSRTSDGTERKPHKLRKIIDETLVMTGAKARRSGVEIKIDCDENISLNCDEIEIEQVMVNLLNNAIDAVSSLNQRWVRVEVQQHASEIVVRVLDSGSGIPAPHADKVFQPFFTTKPVGQGTGLGLAIVKGILDEHDASIQLITSEPNTCFEIRFRHPEVCRLAA